MDFTKPQQPGKNRKLAKAIQVWVEDALPDDLADELVMVSEMQCFEPGCAPLETVVTILHPTKPRVFKIFKPLKEVTHEDAITGLQAALAGTANTEHLSSAPTGEPTNRIAVST